MGAAAAALLMLAMLPSHAQQGVGAKYGSRDPQKCASTKAAGNGRHSASIVKEAVLCANERIVGGVLYLVEDLKIDVSTKGRPFNRANDLMPEIDVTVPIYPIRGSYVRYQCNPVDNQILKNAGKNCNRYLQPQASGLCSTTTFGDWKCSFMDLNNREQEAGVPPPKG